MSVCLCELCLFVKNVCYFESIKINKIQKKTEPRHYHLRRTQEFNVPKYNYSIERTSLSYAGPTVWNILPESYKLTGSHASFKQKIKKDPALLDKISFGKEACLSTKENEDFYYF